MLRRERPGQVVALGREVGLRAVPFVRRRVEIALHVPGAGRVVGVIRNGMAAQRGAHVKAGLLRGRDGGHRQIQMVLLDEVDHVRGAEVIPLRAEGVGEVEEVDALLVGHDDVAVVRNAFGDEVVAADGLHPPDLMGVLEADAVHLVGAIPAQQLGQPQHALAGGVDVGEDDREHVLLADAAGDERVRAQHAGVGGDRLGLGHGDVAGVEAGLAPDAAVGQGVGHGGIAHGVLRQVDDDLGDDGLVAAGLLPGLHDDKPLGREAVGAGILVPGHHRGAVIGGVFADQNGGAGHGQAFLCQSELRPGGDGLILP